MANYFDNLQGVEHVVAESSLIKATSVGHMYSLKCHDDLDNGAIVARGAWVEAQVYNSKKYAAGDQPLFILTSPTGYNSDRKECQEEKYFYNAEGEIARAYELVDGDIFTVSSKAITALATAPVMNNYLTVGDNGLYTETASKPSTGIVLQILDKVVYTNSVSYRVLVAKTGA